MNELRRKVLLPVVRLSELTDHDDPLATKRSIKQGKGHPSLIYWYRYVADEAKGRGYNYNLFPVVLDKNSVPWSLGTLFILDQLEGETRPIMSTCHARADDLGAFKEWLDTHNNPDEILFNFPKPKLRRTTYCFRGFLQLQVQAHEIGATTAKRRIKTVISFYRWLLSNGYFTPEYPTWEEKKYELSFRTREGGRLSKTMVSTDVALQAPRAEDDFDGTIQDGGKLRPLSLKEQDWLLEASETTGNSECLLIQLFMLGTGSRIESACTLRVRHFSNPAPRYSKSVMGEGEVYRLKAGPGTGIETKNSKCGTLQVPRVLYELLHTYSLSRRAQLRRERYVTRQDDHLDMYLFLTNQGSPYYIAKGEAQQFNPNLDRRYTKNGQPVRQFIKDHAIPYVREKYDRGFFYRPHDLRASFGMNMTEHLTRRVQEGKITLHQARLIVKDLMWHRSGATTDRYLDYRKHIEVFHKAIDGYGEHLQLWSERAMRGLAIDE